MNSLWRTSLWIGNADLMIDSANRLLQWLLFLPDGEVLEDRTPDEFAHDGCSRNETDIQGQEPFQKRKQTLRFDEFRRTMRHLSQQWFGKRLEGGEFIRQRRVEHYICIFLKGEDMLLLSPPDGFPARDSLGGGVAALSGVAHDTADESRVRGGNAVVTIEV